MSEDTKHVFLAVGVIVLAAAVVAFCLFTTALIPYLAWNYVLVAAVPSVHPITLTQGFLVGLVLNILGGGAAGAVRYQAEKGRN